MDGKFIQRHSISIDPHSLDQMIVIPNQGLYEPVLNVVSKNDPFEYLNHIGKELTYIYEESGVIEYSKKKNNGYASFSLFSDFPSFTEDRPKQFNLFNYKIIKCRKNMMDCQNFWSIYHNLQEESYIIDVNNIEATSESLPDFIYPKIGGEWIKKDENVAYLSSLTIAIDALSRFTYKSTENWTLSEREICQINNEFEKWIRPPESIKKKLQVFGLDIPWEIDYQKTAWKIIDISGINEFNISES